MSDAVEYLRNQVAYHQASLASSLAPYLDRPEVQTFQEQARQKLASAPNVLKSISPTASEYPKWIERCNNGLNKVTKTISLNCRLIALGHNPPGWDPYAWNVLAALAGMEGCDLEDDAQAYRLLTRLHGRAEEQDAVERRRASPAPSNESRRTPPESQEVKTNDARPVPVSTDVFGLYRIEDLKLVLVGDTSKTIEVTHKEKWALERLMAAGRDGVRGEELGDADKASFRTLVSKIKAKLKGKNVPDYIRTPTAPGLFAGEGYAIWPE